MGNQPDPNRIRFGVSKETVEERAELRKVIPEAYYTLQFKGFYPRLSKNRKSVNLNPRLVVVNTGNPQIDGQKRIFENLNQNADWVQRDFCHALHVEMEDDGSGVLAPPGYFTGKDGVQPDPMNPDTWQWVDTAGLMDRTMVVKIVIDQAGTPLERNSIDHYRCAFLPSECKEKHTAHLVKS